MSRRKLFCCYALLVMALLMMAQGCVLCSPRKGLIFRGDWAFEINRVPWVKERDSNYKETGEGPYNPHAVTAGSIGAVGCEASAAEAITSPPPLEFVPPRPGASHGRGVQSAPATPSPEPNSQSAHPFPRFSPVPMHSAYQPRQSAAPAGTGTPKAHLSLLNHPIRQPGPLAEMASAQPSANTGAISRRH